MLRVRQQVDACCPAGGIQSASEIAIQPDTLMRLAIKGPEFGACRIEDISDSFAETHLSFTLDAQTDDFPLLAAHFAA